MKKILLRSSLLSFIALASLSAPTFAVDPSMFRERPPVSQEQRDDRAKGPALQVEMATEKRQEKIAQITTRVEKRFALHEKRLENIISRMKEHITEREAAGKDMTAAQTAVATAEKSLATAKELGVTAVAQLQALTPENWNGQSTEAKEARAAVKKAQVAYAQVVKDFKTAVAAMKKAQ